MFTQSVSSQIQNLIREPLYFDVAEREQLERNVQRSRESKGFLCAVPGETNYTLVFDDDALPDGHQARNVITVNSMKEVMLYYGLLGGACEMYLSPEYLFTSDERLQKLEEIHEPLARDLLDETDAENLSSLLRKLPLDLSGLLESPLAVKDEDVVPSVIDPYFIHKSNPENALLSEPHFEGRLSYYNMLRYSMEIRFDHESDHVQGMLLLEAMRQAALATTHLMGNLPKTGAMTLMSYCTNFYNYIEHDAPVIIRAYTSYTVPESQKDKEGYVICQVFQWGKLCADSTLGAVAFLDKDRYGRHRSISKKLSERNRRRFASKIQAAA